MIQLSFAVIFPFGNGKAIFYIISPKSLRLVPISRPLWQPVVHIQHSRPIEYVVSRLNYIPVLDSRVLVTVQLPAPGAPFVDLRIQTGNTTTALLASKTSLPWFASNLVEIQGFFRIAAVGPTELSSVPVNGMDEGGS